MVGPTGNMQCSCARGPGEDGLDGPTARPPETRGLGFRGFIGVILGLYWVYRGIMEKKMETIGIIG